MKKIVHTDKAPAPIVPYSQAVWAGTTLFVSGQIAINPANGNLVQDSLQAEATQVMENLKAILENEGLTFGNIVKTSIFLSDMKLFAEVNEVYAQYFKSDFPARETVAVLGLPKGVNVEISVVAIKL
jgi:2-iminobutanoate/2-iminopropanoate deaminase